MPLHILALLVVFGIIFIIGVVHYAGGSKQVPPLTSQNAASRFALDFPNFKTGETVVSADGKSVLLLSDHSKNAGLVVRMGNRSLTRLISSRNFKQITLVDDGLEILLRDFTLPKVQMMPKQVDDLHRIESHLDRLIGVVV